MHSSKLLKSNAEAVAKKLKPVIFKAHIMNCSSLFDDSESFREVAEGADFD